MSHPYLTRSIQANAGVIVTENLRHFAAAALNPLGIRAMSLDQFLVELIPLQLAVFGEVLNEMSVDYTRPPMTIEALLASLGRHAPQFAAELAKAADPPPS